MGRGEVKHSYAKLIKKNPQVLLDGGASHYCQVITGASIFEVIHAGQLRTAAISLIARNYSWSKTSN